jgi:hypothetical protein
MPNHISKISLAWNADVTLETLKAYEGEALKFTLTFTWSAGKLESQTRS